MVRPQPATTVRKTPNFDFIFGRYGHASLTVPYFQVSMSFDDIAKYLVLVTEMPGASSMNWKVEELFQRDIDWWRVQRKIVPYLKQQEQPHFFNSLTIALLPVKGEAVHDFSEPRLWHAPVLEGEHGFTKDRLRHLGPVTCGYWAAWSDPGEDNARLGQICWNTNEVCAVAIDGQHRLAAIKDLGQTGVSSFVPVILIVLHPDLGFAKPGRDHVIETLRRLFIDLNKHAQKVSRAREILLDDRDPVSICVRALIGDQLIDGHSELEQRPPTLPLSLVDWHSEQALFDKGPYLTTILGMDWAVAKVLGIGPFEDPMAHEEIDRLISRLENRLDIDLDKARKRLQECDRYERPFGFVEEPTDELHVIADGFKSMWSSALVCLLTRLTPYHQLIQLRVSLGTLSPEFSNWYALKEGADNAKGVTKAATLLTKYENELASRANAPIAQGDLSDALKRFVKFKRKRQLAFTVVFQRALFLAFLQYMKITRQILSELGESNSVEIDLADDEVGEAQPELMLQEERAAELVEALNKLIAKEPDFLKVGFEIALNKNSWDRFWLCSLQDPQGTIDFTQSASRRTADLLLLGGIFWIYHKVEGLGRRDFDALIDRADSADSGLDLKLSQCLGRLHLPDQSIALRILRSRNEPESTDEMKWDVMKPRVAWLWDTLVG